MATSGDLASREGQSAPPPAARNEAVQELEGRAADSSEAKIVVFPAHQIPVGREIGALFELAHWPVNLIETPQEPFHQRYVEGVEIAGANSVLVDTVASALDTAGIPSISKVIRKSKIPKDNPKRRRAMSRTSGDSSATHSLNLGACDEYRHRKNSPPSGGAAELTYGSRFSPLRSGAGPRVRVGAPGQPRSASFWLPSADTPIGELLRRGQHLSAQAAGLLRAVERADERARS